MRTLQPERAPDNGHKERGRGSERDDRDQELPVFVIHALKHEEVRLGFGVLSSGIRVLAFEIWVW